MKMLHTIKFGLMIGLLTLFANTASAATLFLTPATGEFGINKEITVDLKIDSDGTGINAAQATLRYPKDILEVTSISKTDSAFSFWLEEPTFSNADGIISFVGGTPYGVSGASIQVLHIVFATKSAGVGTLSFVDEAITASDGTGTNVLSKKVEAAFTVSPVTIAAVVTAPTVTPPTQIKREPASAIGIPKTPVLNIPSYPKPTDWYNHTNIFTVSWQLPRDITEVATALNKQPNFIPTKTEGLFDNKMFEALTDGVWYLHVQFKNDIGWSDTAHYRIAIDTKTPLPFEVTSLESEANENPSPVFNFKTTDALSGINEYRARVDNENWMNIPMGDFSGSYKLPLQAPGKHRLTVRAIDNAGNSIEDYIDFETLPLLAPAFTFTTTKLFSDEATGLTFKGTALPKTEVLFTLKKGTELISSNAIHVNANGDWEFTFVNPLRNGTYTAAIQTKDSRGALSLVVTAPKIQVTGRYTTLIITVITILIGFLIGGYFFYKKRQERTALRVQLAKSDTAKVFKMIETDLEKITNSPSTPTGAAESYLGEKLKEKVKKMAPYIEDTIDRARE